MKPTGGRIPSIYLLLFAALSTFLLLVIAALPSGIFLPLISLLQHSTSDGLRSWFGAHKIAVFLAIATFAVILIVVAWRLRQAIFMMLRTQVAYINMLDPSETSWRCIILSVTLLTVIHLPTLRDGSFISDDFELIRANRSRTVGDLLLRTHGDHVMPVYRLEVMVLDFLSGTNPFGWNLALLVSYSSALLVMGLFMKEIGVGSLGIVLGLTTYGLSHTVSLALLGYYCLNIPMQAATLALAATMCYLRGDRNSFLTLVGHTLLVINCLIDVANVWVFGAVPLLYFAASIKGQSLKDLGNWISERRWCVFTWFFIGILLVVFYAAAFRFGSGARFLVMQSDRGVPLTFWGAFCQSVYYFSSGIVSELYFPGFRGLPSHFQFLVLAIALVAVILGASSASHKDRRILAAVSIILLVLDIEVSVARPMSGTYFGPQYVTAAQMYASIVAALVLSVIWSKTNAREGLLALVMAGTLVTQVGCWFPCLIEYRLKMTSGMKMLNRLRDLDTRMAGLLKPPADHLEVIPDIPAGKLGAFYPVQKWEVGGIGEYPLSAFTDFLSIGKSPVRIGATRVMHPIDSSQVDWVESLRRSVSPSFLERVALYPELGEVYLNRQRLRSDPEIKADVSGGQLPKSLENLPSLLHGAKDVLPISNVGVEFSTDGGADVVIAEGSWDPESKSVLRLNVDRISDRQDFEIGVSFQGNIPASRESWVDAHGGGSQHFKINLLQSVHYALCTNIHEIRLVFGSRGRYRLENVSFSDH